MFGGTLKLAQSINPKCKTVDFRLKSHFTCRKSATKFLCVKTINYQCYEAFIYEAFIVLTIREKMIGGGDPFYLKFWIKVPRWSEIADFRFLFTPSDSAVTPSEKKFN